MLERFNNQFVMNYQSFLIKETDQDLLCDTQIQSPAHIYELQQQVEALEQEKKSLELVKKVSEREAFNLVNGELYQSLIELNDTNTALRKAYKQMMSDRQLKKENYYRQQNQPNPSLRSSGTFSLSSAKLEHISTPKHNTRNLFNSHVMGRNSLCLIRKSQHVSRQSFDNKYHVKKQEPKFGSENIFLNLFSLIVQEEKQTGKEMFGGITLSKIQEYSNSNNITHLSEVGKYLDSTYVKIQKMMELMRLYQDRLDKSSKECDQLQSVINQFTGARSKLDSIYLRVHNIPHMKEQIKTKQQYISTDPSKCKPSSLDNMEMLLQMFNCNQGNQLQRLQAFSRNSHKLIIDPRQSKIKQLIESIRVSRSKFNQIYEIYMERIKTLELKLEELK